MIRKYQRLTVLMAGMMMAGAVQAQDPELSQFYAAPMYTNPAMAGSAFCNYGAAGRVALNYRNQWPSLPGTFRSFAASWDQHIPDLGGGLGIMAFRDVAGTGLLTTTSFSGVYSYMLPVNKKLYMRFGLQATYSDKRIDVTKLRFSDQIDPTQGFVRPTNEQFPTTSIGFPNFAAGWMMYTSKFYFGLAAHNIVEPNQSFFRNPDGKLPRRYTMHSGAILPIGPNRRDPNSFFSPNVLVMVQQNFSQMNLGFYMTRGPLVSGLWFRQTFGNYGTSDALMALIGFRKDRFKFGYSFDITVSDGNSAIPYSHEVSAIIEWCVPPGRRPFKPLRCPEF
jgi:type IX secretion system PorP/SprF family membrane protein